MHEILEDFISLFFPKYCFGCEGALVKGETLVCTACIYEMARTNYHLHQDNLFYHRLRGRLPIKYAMAFFKFIKGSRVQNLLHALKYENKPELAKMLGRVYGNELLQAGFQHEFDYIIPVPLHPVKHKRRGYNQSEEFGQGLSEILRVPCSSHFLSRVKVTETQTRKSKLGRWENVEDVFKLNSEDALKGKRILLVDDIVTTGSTLEACGKKLLPDYCKELSIACIAATQ
jgi:ComF family protein